MIVRRGYCCNGLYIYIYIYIYHKRKHELRKEGEGERETKIWLEGKKIDIIKKHIKI